MPKPSPKKPLARLDAEAAGCHSIAVSATLPGQGKSRLSLQIETSATKTGEKIFQLRGIGRERERTEDDGTTSPNRMRKEAKRVSTLLRGFAGTFPDAELPPSRLTVSCRGTNLAPSTIERMFLEALAEALGKELPAAPAAGSRRSSGAIDWPAVLRSGPKGLSEWRKLKSDQRRAVDLSGADLGGLDLSRANFAGVCARKARFSGATLANAMFSNAHLDRADFTSAGLQDARFLNASAPEAVFRGAKLAGADLKHAMLFGTSFDGADLTGADLSDANLHRAELAGATLDGVNLAGASFDGRTTWPPGFAIPAEAIFAGKGTDPRLVGKGKSAVAADINGLMARFQNLIDPKRMKRTLDMLKSGKNQLFAEVEPTLVRGIVRSQREDDLVYSCVLVEDGTYACCTPDLEPCMGLRGEPCKHLLVLLIGLARAGEIDPTAVDRWVVAARGKPHRWNKMTKDHVSDTLLRYKGVQAGEVDWRPTETLPEDFYAM